YPVIGPGRCRRPRPSRLTRAGREWNSHAQQGPRHRLRCHAARRARKPMRTLSWAALGSAALAVAVACTQSPAGPTARAPGTPQSADGTSQVGSQVVVIPAPGNPGSVVMPEPGKNPGPGSVPVPVGPSGGPAPGPSSTPTPSGSPTST